MPIPGFVRRLWGSETLEHKVKSITSSIRKSGGNNPIVLFDTSAIIDFERIIDESRLKDRDADPSSFYGYMVRTGFPLFVTPGVYEEVENHRKHVSISGRPEISGVTGSVTEGMRINYFDACQKIDAALDDPERLRHDAYWASHLAFHHEEHGVTRKSKNLHKKAYGDPISAVDRELIGQALVLRQMMPIDKPYDHVEERPCTGVVILSPDRHVHDSVRVLTDQHPDVEERFGYSGIHVVSSRENWK